MKSALFFALLTTGLTAFGQAAEPLVLSTTLYQDPVKVKACIERSKRPSQEAVPFLISPRLFSLRSADQVFIALDDGEAVEMVECGHNANGVYGPIDTSGGGVRYWSEIKPTLFEPSVDTDEGKMIARDRCIAAATSRLNRPPYDDSVMMGDPIRPGNRSSGGSYGYGTLVGGAPTARWDWVVEESNLYKNGGLDEDQVKYTCLFNSMLELKGFEFGWVREKTSKVTKSVHQEGTRAGAPMPPAVRNQQSTPVAASAAQDMRPSTAVPGLSASEAPLNRMPVLLSHPDAVPIKVRIPTNHQPGKTTETVIIRFTLWPDGIVSDVTYIPDARHDTRAGDALDKKIIAEATRIVLGSHWRARVVNGKQVSSVAQMEILVPVHYGLF